MPSKDLYFLGNSIETVNLSSNGFSLKAFEYICNSIAQMENLKSITFNNNCVKDAPLFFSKIGKCTKIEKIELKSVVFSGGNFSSEIKKALSNLKQLKTLNFAFSNISDENVKAIAEPLAKMKELEKINLKSLSLTTESMEPLLH